MSKTLVLLIAIDVWLMTHLFNGKPGETMSAAAWSLEQSGHFFGFFRPVIDGLFYFIQKDHCARCWLEENQ